ncbi:hypothetical protein BME96_18970 (plasmid) [Virgibacillus halodenitrificans]|uniref:Uncharacterized protein n=1 Tax=Virgibacillus halodenitrificans TaxID=1482 RepID=A0AAC9NNA5_VIRHA|nr:hypothetical protein [Virgibacillus halodenitrificans]APC50366.1 hypothetical protein BME96_18970 [Virgibacillus halodenitrificans]CDQ37681.1 hypothetical protein BN993_07243 [Virgibacillus halodenitrificans]
MSGFLESRQSNNERDPFAKKKKSPETKVVKLNADLHYILKTHVAYENDGTTITDHINKAVTEYVKKNNIDPLKK